MRTFVVASLVVGLLSTAAPAQAEPKPFQLDRALLTFHIGPSYSVNQYTGGTSAFELQLKLVGTNYLSAAFSFHGGYDIVRGFGEWTWKGVLGYRRFFLDEEGFGSTLLVGATSGYWLQGNGLDWVPVALHLQIGIVWFATSRFGFGVEAGFVAGGNISVNDVAGSHPFLISDVNISIHF